MGFGSAGLASAQDTIEQAIGYWLANDDAAAFPALSALAIAGDERAMLFLGAIELRSGNAQSDASRSRGDFWEELAPASDFGQEPRISLAGGPQR
jgi:hypothetical protein